MALNINGTTGISGVDGSLSAPAVTGTDSNTGITFPAADTIKFSAGGVEKLAITASGLSGDGSGLTGVGVTNITSNASGITVSTGSTSASFDLDNSSAHPRINFKSNTLAQAAIIEVAESSGGGEIKFFNKHTSGTSIEAMRISNNGDFRINSSNNSGNNMVNNPSFYSSTGSGAATYRPHTGHPVHHFYSDNGGTYSLKSYVDGAGAYTNLSDYRLKENIVSISNGIDIIKQLNPVKFDWKSSSSVKDDLGFIAHEVQAVIPTAVDGTKDQLKEDGSPFYQGLAQAKIIPHLTAALQEAIAKIETLETKVAALEAG